MGYVIPQNQALGPYTNLLAEIYKENIEVPQFGMSLFKSKVVPTKYVSVQVQRNLELLAVDVWRGSEGNMNKSSLSTEKILEPLYFRENFNLQDMQLYDALFMPRLIENAGRVEMLLRSIVDEQITYQNNIKRAIEKMCWQVIHNGKVEMSSNGTGIIVDYKRRTASIVDPGSGNYWANNVDPFKQIEAGCKFVRTEGKTAAMTFNMIMGDEAIADLFANTKFIDRQNKYHLILDRVVAPQAQLGTQGSVWHGQISAGPYSVNLWSYPQYYDVMSGTTRTSSPYINSKFAYILPVDPKFTLFYGAPPQLADPNGSIQTGEFIFSEYKDVQKRSHTFDIESCPLPVPVAVDQAYSLQAVA